MRNITALLAIAVLAVGVLGCHHRYRVLKTEEIKHSAELTIDRLDHGVLYVTAKCPTGMGYGALDLDKHFHRDPSWPVKIVVQLAHTSQRQFSSLEQFHATVERSPGQVHELRTKQLVNPKNWIQVEIYLEPADRTARVINVDWIATYRI